MKFILLAAVVLVLLNHCAALQCWGPGGLGKLCLNANGKAIDTTQCVKDSCSSGQMCVRTTASAGSVSATTLLGCAPASEAKCTTATGTGLETCFCDSKDFCNSASYGSYSVMTLIGSVTAFLVAMFR